MTTNQSTKQQNNKSTNQQQRYINTNQSTKKQQNNKSTTKIYQCKSYQHQCQYQHHHQTVSSNGYLKARVFITCDLIILSW
jgi:hypothetical protein